MMGFLSNLLGFAFFLYMFGMMAYWPYAWATRTSKSDHRQVRQRKAIGQAVIWPYSLAKVISERQAEAAADVQRESRSKDLLE